jgi:hypothetical protein
MQASNESVNELEERGSKNVSKKEKYKKSK